MTASMGKGDDLNGRLGATTIALGVGVVLVVCTWRDEQYPDLTLGGAVGLGLVICVVAYLATVPATAGRQSAPTRVGSVAAVALFAGVAMVLASSSGLLVRWLLDAQYAAIYGDKVVVTLSDQCIVYERVYRGGVHAADRTECAHSTWRVDGRDHTGTAIVAWDADGGPGRPEQIQAYAVGDRAFTMAEKERTRLALWGGVPLWVLWVGLATALIALVALVRLGWASRQGWSEVQEAT